MKLYSLIRVLLFLTFTRADDCMSWCNVKDFESQSRCKWTQCAACPGCEEQAGPICGDGCCDNGADALASTCPQMGGETHANCPEDCPSDCPWLEGTTDTDDVMECMDGSTCHGEDDGWDCCALLGGRAKCPPNVPNLCATPNECGDGTSHCCQENCAEHGGNLGYCPWLEGTTDTDDVMECMDGSTCHGDDDGWDCCALLGGRVKCPPNIPHLCAKRNKCGGGTSRCCEEDCTEYGGNLGCIGCPDATCECTMQSTYNSGASFSHEGCKRSRFTTDEPAWCDVEASAVGCEGGWMHCCECKRFSTFAGLFSHYGCQALNDEHAWCDTLGMGTGCEDGTKYCNPCDCQPGTGWSTDLKACAAGATTSCQECPTLDGCVASECIASSCPLEYDPLHVCQCTADCADYGNCCNDAPMCDPCNCPDGYGWDSDTSQCAEGSTTNCSECPTMEGCISDTCAKSFCPQSYDPKRVCQCTADCADYGNCCNDAPMCDACFCSDGFGWSSTNNACFFGSSTNCVECPSGDGCHTTNCRDGFCPQEYDPMRTCQCTADCFNFENCCDDSHKCDACFCSDGFGFDSGTDSCQMESSTNCSECPSLAKCVTTNCADAGCPRSYESNRVCQCTDNCASHGNCCADAQSECSWSASECKGWCETKISPNKCNWSACRGCDSCNQ